MGENNHNKPLAKVHYVQFLTLFLHFLSSSPREKKVKRAYKVSHSDGLAALSFFSARNLVQYSTVQYSTALL